ncbi:MAG TPA: acyltransferase family protein [Steroidobacteraceae bacterium]|jgi:peptidoglycan/LPS O-acetylase OafA/YrhL|nr:acyltransferase family protein [Steroidobacteraceae bacterium]
MPASTRATRAGLQPDKFGAPAVGLFPTAGVDTARAAPARVRGLRLAYRPDIDGLRALAVAMVIAYHALPKVRGAGFIGVDVFFVISGYLITQIILAGLQAGTFSLGAFYQRRVRRIVPALLVVIAASAVCGWLTLFPAELQVLGQSISWCASFLANVFFARAGSGYFDSYAASVPLLHLWSLGVEEQFYFAWPVLLVVAARYGLTLRVLVLVTATSLAISIWGIWHAPLAYFFLPASRAWELAAGGILAAWPPATASIAGADPSRGWRERSYVAPAASVAGVTLITAVLVFADPERVPAAISSVIATAGALLLIMAGPLAPLNRQLLGSRPMIFIGRISYPLYLWHWPLFSFTRIILGHALPPAFTVAAIAVASAAAYATYRWVEMPVRYGRSVRWMVPALLAGLAILALAGAALGTGWISGRLSGAAFTAWDAAVTDWHYSDGANTGGRAEFLTRSVGGRGHRTAVFIGDSHLQQYWPRVVHVVETQADSARSAVLAVYYGCPPLPGITSVERGRDCGGFFDYGMQLAAQPGVDTVVFGAFWEKYLLGEYSVAHGAQPVYRAADPGRAALQLDAPGTRIVLEQFRQAIATLVASGRRVFIVLSNPTSPQYDPASMLPAGVRLSLSSADPVPLAGSRRVDAGAYESYVAPLMDRLRAIAAHSGAQLVDPRATLCSGLDCPATGADGLPLYLDSNHLRAGYARERASFVDEMLLGP